MIFTKKSLMITKIILIIIYEPMVNVRKRILKTFNKYLNFDKAVVIT